MLKSVEIMKQLIKINEKCCCVESFFSFPTVCFSSSKKTLRSEGRGGWKRRGVKNSGVTFNFVFYLLLILGFVKVIQRRNNPQLPWISTALFQ